MRCVSSSGLGHQVYPAWRVRLLTIPRRRPRRRAYRPSWIALLLSPPILPFLLPLTLARADTVNITIDDTSSSILYTPASSWHASSLPCSSCLMPDASQAMQGTWHDGTHIIPTVDGDDVSSSTSSASPAQTSKAADGNDSDDDDEEKGKKGKGKPGRKEKHEKSLVMPLEGEEARPDKKGSEPKAGKKGKEGKKGKAGRVIKAK